jgi:CHASE3 domain sensor protein
MQHVFEAAFSVLIQVLVVLFSLGVAGCLFVVVISFWDDIKTIASHAQSEPNKVGGPYEF